MECTIAPPAFQRAAATFNLQYAELIRGRVTADIHAAQRRGVRLGRPRSYLKPSNDSRDALCRRSVAGNREEVEDRHGHSCSRIETGLLTKPHGGISQ